ncbi:helix-turn-helix domain-containing protein [Hydrogenophaga sp. YM1]|uniref:IclR family transcriptional regulator n=1 Tax=Hydrogenophaga sp. YM1 TaxID=2806262 RepID=UPI00195BCF2A|nr:helix-turn-helix domain-containing protein [Hydrogenophaga sp. YM1]QRR33991.1 helix-turn-helix domain-containing protein [Hydrogenophaga sp. YM1]
MYMMDAPPLVKSAQRVLQLLEFFAHDKRRATVMQVATALDYPQSSTSMLLGTLETLGYLRYEASERTYIPTLRVMLLGSWLQDELFGSGSLISAMNALRERTRETVMVGLRQGIHVRFILSLRGPRSTTLQYPVGVLRPVCRSAVGKILLSALPNSEILKIARRANAEAQPEDKVPTGELMTEIAAIRERGWALTVDYPLPDRATLAMALPPIPDQPAMALIVGTRKARMAENQERYVRELRATCESLASQLRGDVPG